MQTKLDESLDEIVVKAAEQFRIDVNLVRAIILKESEGDSWRPRYEPAFKDSNLWEPRAYAERLRITAATETVLQKMSWGVMQIMGATARWQGFESSIPMLCTPEIGVFYGVKYLRWLTAKFEDEDHVVAAYNAGPGVKKTAGGQWTNQMSYVDPVYQILRGLRALV